MLANIDNKGKDRMNIVCISPSPWDYPIWTNRQHIMSRLAKKNNIIYVFHPPYLRSSIKRNVIKRGLTNISTFSKINASLLTFTPFVVPFSRNFLFVHKLNAKLSATILKSKLNRLGIKEFVLWFYDPEAVYYLDYITPVLSCYDCVDEYSKMPFYNTPRKRNRLLRLENRLAESCDIVFATSQKLFEKKKLQNSDTFLVENVGDYEHFSLAQTATNSKLADFPDTDGPIIGFVGALDSYKVDFHLVRYIAENRPDWTILLIGGFESSNSKENILPSIKNIYCLGRKKYSELPDYISKFDVCIIPYLINEYTRHVFPIKLFEFLASGKPVVTTELPSLEKYSDIINLVSNREEFIQKIEKAFFFDSETLKRNRIELARKNTWETRANSLIAHVSHKLQEKAL